MITKIYILFVLSGISLLEACQYANKQDLLQGSICDTIAVRYSTTVQGILNAHCNSCHSGTLPSGGIKLDQYPSVKTLVDNGKLWGTMSHQNGYKAMPQSAPKLEACILEKIRSWIQAGAQNN